MESAGLESGAVGGLIPPHIDRWNIFGELRDQLHQAFNAGSSEMRVDWRDRLIVVAGPRCAGKTHAVLHALDEVRSDGVVEDPDDVTVLLPRGTPEAYNQVAAAVHGAKTGRNTSWQVVFVDDFGHALATPDMFSLQKLCESPNNKVIVIVSLWEQHLPTSATTIATTYQDRHQVFALLRNKAIGVPKQWQQDEIAEAQRQYPNIDSSEPAAFLGHK